MNIWVTSDTHFCHNKEFVYKPRGFNSLYDMEEYIIQDWNSKVQDNDIVYHLGDFALGMDEHRLNNIISRLKGTIYLVRGNHDTDNKLKFYNDNWGWKIKRVEHADDPIKYNGKVFMLSHYRMSTSNLESSPRHCVINLHGHEHIKEVFFEERPYTYNVILDAHNCQILSLDNICDDINNKINECLNYCK